MFILHIANRLSIFIFIVSGYAFDVDSLFACFQLSGFAARIV